MDKSASERAEILRSLKRMFKLIKSHPHVKSCLLCLWRSSTASAEENYDLLNEALLSYLKTTKISLEDPAGDSMYCVFRNT